MKFIGIIGAMEEEVAKLKDQMSNVEVQVKAKMEFYSGTLYEKNVVVVRSGIGKVNAAICTQILIDDFKVEAVLNTGIAGSLRNEINIGDIVIATDVIQHDVDAREFGYNRGQIPRMDTLSFVASKELGEKAQMICKEVNPSIDTFMGRIVSGDQFIADKQIKEDIKSCFDGYCTEMEGAAIGHVAYLNEIPFLIVRAISDKADNSATMDYPTFERQAIEHTVKLVEGLLKTI